MFRKRACSNVDHSHSSLHKIMAKSTTNIVILLGLLSIGDGLLFDDGTNEIKESITPFIYHDHAMYNLSMLREVIEEHGTIYLVIPSDPPMELQLDNSRIPDQFQITTYGRDMQPFTQQSLAENCFYHGKVSSHKDSFAVIDGCQAPIIRGYISIDGGVLLLEPAEDDDGAHILRTHMSQSALSTFFSTKPISKKGIVEERDEGDTLDREPRQLQQEMSPLFIEIYVVYDNAMFEQFNRNLTALQAKIRMVIEVLKEISLDLGVYVHLSGLEIWNEGNLITPLNNGLRTMFDDFLLWRHNNLAPRQKHDFPMLISGSGYTVFESNPPRVYPSHICSGYYSGLAIKEVNLDDPILPSLLARHMAFNMGLNKYDPEQCPCSDPSGCIMDKEFRGWTRGPPTKFASCSKQELQTVVNRGTLRCLENQPAGFIFPPRCGDGNVDEGENCDCGPGEECLDICCDAATCTYNYSIPECRPTTIAPSTTQNISPTTTQVIPPTTTPEPTTTPSVFETTYVEDFVTELEMYDFTTSTVEVERVSPTTVSSDVTTLPATTERLLTEEEIRIQLIKEILGAESIQVPPTLIQGPAGGEVEYFTARSNVTIPCEVSGLPLPSISWFKDEDELNIVDDALLFNEDGSLKIIGVDVSDAGDYYCKGNNTHGVVISETVSLSLAYLDSLFMNPLEVYEINERDSLVLRCQIPGSNPPPEVYWTKDLHTKEPVEVGGGVTQTPAGDLVISSARPEHSGDYTCIVTNPVTREVRVAQSITVKVEALARAPNWEYTSPQQSTIQRGKPFSLHCIPSGSPVPSVKWEKLLGGGEGVEVRGYSQTLTMPSPDEGDSGQYTCTATNGVGESTEEVFTVTVVGAPKWIAKPTNVEIPAGASHSIHCAASGIPLPDISWLVNGKPAQGEVVRYPHLSFSSEPGSGVFNITDGIYLNVVLQCVAENSHGRLIANAYVNIIVFPARIISPPPQRVSVIEGQDVTIPCQGLGAPEPEIYWQVGVKVLEANEDGSLFIPAAGIGDANSYYCRVRNKYGHEDVKMLLHVRGLTQVAISTDEISIEEESELILNCQVEHYADTAPEIKWSKPGGRPLDYNRTLIEFNQDMTMSSLLIERLMLNDTGYYICTAMTEYDEASDQTYVGVTEKIIIQPPIKPRNLTMDRSPTGLLVMWESEYLPNAPIDSFLVEARNNHYPDQWEAMREVSGDQDSAIVKVNPYVTYWFRVTARNEAGESISSRSRPVSMPSSTPLHNPRNVQVDVMDLRNVRVTWEEMGPIEHAGIKFFYRVRWRPLGTKRWEDVKIRDYTVTEYSFEMNQRDSPGLEVAVKSGNLIGSGPRAAFVSALFVQPTTVAPLTFDHEPPIFARVMEGIDLRLNCSGMGGVDLQTSWYKDGMLVESDNTNYTINDDGSLFISFFGYEDIGEYECSIESSTGETIAALSHLEIRRRTRVVILPPVLEPIENSPVEVFCDIEFDTNVMSADVLWLDPMNNTIQFYGDEINGRVYRNDSSLVIEGVLLSDAGMYMCIAETEEDYAEAAFTLTVKALEPPQVSPQLLEVAVQNSTSLSAAWGSISDEEAGGVVLGYFAVARLRGEVRGERKECHTVATRCQFLGLTPRLTYEVFVAVRTAVGQGPFSSAAFVTMPDQEPVSPGPVRIGRTRVWAKTLTVKWTAPTVGDPPHGYLLSYKAADDDQDPTEKTLTPRTTHFKISGLVPGTMYAVSIEAYNRAGWGPKVTKIVTTESKNKSG